MANLISEHRKPSLLPLSQTNNVGWIAVTISRHLRLPSFPCSEGRLYHDGYRRENADFRIASFLPRHVQAILLRRSQGSDVRRQHYADPSERGGRGDLTRTQAKPVIHYPAENRQAARRRAIHGLIGSAAKLQLVVFLFRARVKTLRACRQAHRI